MTAFVSSIGAKSAALAANVTPTMPSHQTNDVLVCIATSSQEAIALGTANGFAEVTSSPQFTGTGGSAAGIRLGVFWSRATTSNSTPPVITNPGDHCCACIAVVRESLRTGSPFSLQTGGVDAVSDTDIMCPGGTTADPDVMVMVIAANSIDNNASQTGAFTNDYLLNMSKVTDMNTNLGSGSGFGIGTGVMPLPGDFGSTTVQLNNNGSFGASMVLGFLPNQQFPFGVWPTDQVWVDYLQAR